MRYGSLINEIYSGGLGFQPVIGLGVTFLHWSDRTAGTIWNVYADRGDTIVEVSGDFATITQGSEQDGSAQYTYSARPLAPRTHYRQTARGWCRCRRIKTGFSKRVDKDDRIVIGTRNTYYDPSF